MLQQQPPLGCPVTSLSSTATSVSCYSGEQAQVCLVGPRKTHEQDCPACCCPNAAPAVHTVKSYVGPAALELAYLRSSKLVAVLLSVGGLPILQFLCDDCACIHCAADPSGVCSWSRQIV